MAEGPKGTEYLSEPDTLYWEWCEREGTSYYMCYDGDYGVWVSATDEEISEWDKENPSYFFSIDSQFWIPKPWEVICLPLTMSYND